MLKNDINVPLLATIGAISAMLLVTILLGVHAWYLWEVQSEFGEKWGGVTNQRVMDLKQSQLAHIEGGLSRADPEKGTYHIPINDAKKMIAAAGGKLPK